MPLPGAGAPARARAKVNRRCHRRDGAACAELVTARSRRGDRSRSPVGLLVGRYPRGWLYSRSLASAPGIAAGMLFTLAAMELVRASLYLLIGVVIVQVIISWINPHAPLAPVFDALTRPFYALFRRYVPAIGNVDLSPLFVLLVAQIALILFENVVARLVQVPS